MTGKALAKLVIKEVIFICSFLPIYIISLPVLFNYLKYIYIYKAEKVRNVYILNENYHAIMKVMCPRRSHHNGFVTTHVLGRMMYGYTLLVPMNQRVLNRLSEDHNVSSHKWFTTHRVLKSDRIKMSAIYIQSWKQCALPFVTTRALWQLMYLLRRSCSSWFYQIWALCVLWIT